MFVLLVGFYFAAYPVLQFNERHYFHLEFMAWLMLGIQPKLEIQQTWRIWDGFI